MCFGDSAFSIDLRTSGQMIWCPFRISYLKRPSWQKHSWWLFHDHSVAFFRSLRKFHGFVFCGAFCLIYHGSGNDLLAPNSNKPKSKRNQPGGDSLSHKTSSRMTSQSLEGARSGVKNACVARKFGKRRLDSTAERRLPNFWAIANSNNRSSVFKALRDPTIDVLCDIESPTWLTSLTNLYIDQQKANR